MQNEIRHVGKVKGAHGIRGDLYIIIFSKDVSWIDRACHLVLQKQDQSFENYEIEMIKPYKDGFIVHFEGVSDRNLSEKLVGYQVYVNKDLFQSADDEPPYLVEIENYMVVDQTLGQLGRIEGFSSNGIQDLLEVNVQLNGRSFVADIPFVNDFVLQINHEQKLIVTNLPAGLLDINNESEN